MKDPLLRELEDDLGIKEVEVPSTEEQSFHEIYARLTMQEDIILVIDAADEQKVREGLSVVKSRHLAKMKESNVKIPNQKLSFIVHPKTPEIPDGQIKLQVVLSKPKTIKIHQIIIPEGA